MSIKKAIKQSIKIISNPSNEFKDLNKKTFENVLSDYFKILLGISILAGIISMLFYTLRSVYFDIFRQIDISYIRMLNYSSGQATGLLFFYLFTGTFIVFILSMVLHTFFRKLKYVEFLKVMFYSLTPLLLFGWVIAAIPGLIIWTITLFIIGIKTELGAKDSKKGTILERD